MATIQLEDGRKIEVDGNPSQDQIDSLLSDLSPQQPHMPADSSPAMARAKWAANNPNLADLQDLGSKVGSNALNALNYDYHNGLGAVTKGINAAAFGAPRAIAHGLSPQVENAIFPEPTDMPGQLLSGAAQIGGVLGTGRVIASGTGMIMNALKAARIAKTAKGYEDASRAIGDKLKESGKGIEDWHSDIGGNTIAPSSTIDRALQKLPESLRSDIIKNNTSGLVDGEGNAIYKLRDLQSMRNDLGNRIKDASYMPGGIKDQLMPVERNLKDIINEHADPNILVNGKNLSELDKKYNSLNHLVAEARGSLINNKGNTVSIPFDKMMKANDPNIINRLNEASKEIPELKKVMDLSRSRNRAETIKKVLGKDADFFGKLGIIIGGAKKVIPH